MSVDIKALFAEREAERYGLHTRHLNEQMVRMLKTIGFDTGFVRGSGQYLWDRQGAKYLDLLSGFGVFAIGRSNPRVHDALRQVLDSEFPNLIQMDVSPLAGVLAERLLARVPHLEKAFFANSGTESVEAAIKFARAATGRAGIAHCSHSFHGLTFGSLSMNGDTIFKKGFGGFLTDVVEVPFNDLNALEDALKTKKIGGFFVEPIQGKGVNMPDDGYLKGVAELCTKYGTLFIADEIQTGVGAHRQVPRLRALGRGARRGAARQGALGRAHPRWRGAHPQMDFRQAFQPHGPRGGARLDLRQERHGNGGGAGDARRA